MNNYNLEELNEYLKNDWIKDLICSTELEEEKEIRTNIWLKEIEPKRMIYADIYGDLIKEGGKKVLDVGGGINSLTKVISQKNDYTLLDFIAHGGEDFAEKLEKVYGVKWINNDWNKIENMEDYDVIIANDIFPDVDQRLEMFIERMLPHCKELRLVITYYNKPMHYLAKRVDDTELLTFLSWDGEITAMKLRKYSERFIDTSDSQLEYIITNKDSLYRNGRGISGIVLNGDLNR